MASELASSAHWERERGLLAPGLQAVLEWAALTVDSAAGARIRDIDGKEYLDFFGAAGVNSLGHSHPRLIEALSEQLSTWMVGAYGSRARLEMLERLTDLLPAQLRRVQLYSSGSETLEAALRLARSATGGFEVLSFWNGYHGRTGASLAASPGTGRGFGPQPGGNLYAPYANCNTCPLRLRHPECGLACVDFTRDVIKHQSVGALAAVLVEPVQGRAGNVVPPPGYLAALQEVAREFDALLVVDELMTGGGRTGLMFGFERERISPDILTLGKGIGGGYPVGIVASSYELMNAGAFGQPSASSSSFGGFPMACAAVAATLDVMVEERLPEAAAATGGRMLGQLRAALSSNPLVVDVRGVGLAIGVELADPDSGEPASSQLMRDVFTALVDVGLLVMVGGSALRLYPPLTISADSALSGCELLIEVLHDFAVRNGAAE